MKYNIEDLAEKILRLSYSELMVVAGVLCEMTKEPDVWDLTNVNDWAGVLSAWAESTDEAAKEERRAKVALEKQGKA